MEEGVLIIPAYEPNDALVTFVQELRGDFGLVLVVDDGSQTAENVFARLYGLSGVRVLRHGVNRGKGAALKTAFLDVLEKAPEVRFVVTADADGQHLANDVRRVAEACARHPDRLTLGVRTFAADVPFRSRFGNLWTRAEFTLLTGRDVRDTQTGLRGIPRALLESCLRIPGERYEYEIRQLVQAACQWPPCHLVPITTCYADNNATSHYRPWRDSLLTQRALFAAALSARLRRPAADSSPAALRKT